jgi:hypothetical protein
MEDAADHLAHYVLPQVPVRQWVLSFPRRLRFLAARDPRVASRLLDVFTRALFAWQRRRARRLARVLTNVIRKVSRAGLLDDDRTFAEEDAFAALQAAEVDRRLHFQDPFKRARRSAHLDGFSLNAGVRIHENDRQGLERLCRLCGRPHKRQCAYPVSSTAYNWW